MRDKQLWERWRVGRPTSDASGAVIQKHSAPHGDFLRWYLEHLDIPRRKKREDWVRVEERMRAILNQHTLEFTTTAGYTT